MSQIHTVRYEAGRTNLRYPWQDLEIGDRLVVSLPQDAELRARMFTNVKFAAHMYRQRLRRAGHPKMANAFVVEFERTRRGVEGVRVSPK